MIVLGVDPGATGGLAVVSSGLVAAVPMPKAGKLLDWHAIARIIEAWAPDIAYVEDVHAMPGNGVVAMFSFGRSAGGIHGVLGALSVPMVLVRPPRWKKSVLAGTARDKAACIDWCRRRYPDVSLLASPRCRKAHDGMADALAIATYGATMERRESA